MNAFVPTFLIGLREGLEGALVVTVLVAFLVKSDLRTKLPYVWLGVGVAVALSVGFAALLEFTSANLVSHRKELFEATASITAVAFVTWMVFWMRRAARSIGGDLRGKLGHAVEMGSFAVVVTAFLAVAREGLETALFFFATVRSATSGWSVIAIVTGLAAAAAIGLGLYASAVRINLTKFFTWTGAFLIVVAAGIFKYGVHDLQEADIVPGLNRHAFDISHLLDPTTWYAEVLRGTFNVTPVPTVLETVAWLAYALPVLLLFLRPRRTPAPAPTEG
ncbi:high-affinity iron transporter [Allocatelliglobosispora scoriae]|uniref:High-affinity iron transporter n=1 Tax=Allocatelliglobosispora scoriae TaxID=643052 RepID=A0A841BYV9_9ACTN|nr:iron uptake transporter permease EfeU [Allocatelliglobosispora scoriae]MBB5874327.1 high-affinity iron transporter [Allocatelliglobosispora scoriae]